MKFPLLLIMLSIASVAIGQEPSAPVLSLSTDGNYVQLSWTEVAGAEGYTLFYADYPEANSLGSLDMMAQQSVAAEMPAGSAFYIAVQAYNEEGSSEYSNVESFSLPVEEENDPAQACSTDSLYSWPLAGVNGKEWVINNYVDLMAGAGLQDYASAPGVPGKTYDGHNGIDIDIASFREMDAGVDIFAISSGTVSSVIDTNADRSTFCASTPWNVVVVEQVDGNRVYYGHMRTNSAAVAVGQVVERGDLLGQVGSSGCSTQPHLHLELRDQNDLVVDPFRDELWCDAPQYEMPVSIMTGFLLEAPSFSHSEPFKDPPPDLQEVQLGTQLLPIVHAANGSIGDEVGVRIISPDGTVAFDSVISFSGPQRHSNWLWNAITVQAAGSWRIEYRANDEAQYELQFEVE